MAARNPPLYENVSGAYSGAALGLPHRDLIGEGVRGRDDLRVSQRGAGANMSVDITSGVCWIMGDTDAEAQPLYRCYNDATINATINTADATNPRVDQVIAEVLDSSFSGSSQLWQTRVMAGTATAGATLDNRSGAAALGNTMIRLADVLVGAAVSSITNANIRDRRPFGYWGVVPPMITDVDMVALIPNLHLSATVSSVRGVDHATMDLFQGAALMFLPRRIVGATKMRWRYVQGSTAMAGNYIAGIYDTSGTKIVTTASTAWTGANSSIQNRSETIAATTFERGYYYVFFGNDSTAGAAFYRGAVSFMTSPNTFFHSPTGGVTAPATIRGFTDIGTDTSVPDCIAVPAFALSVG